MKITKNNFDEARYRAKLQKSVSPGGYQIGAGKMVVWTGKGGMIDFEVCLIKSFLEDGMEFEETLYEVRTMEIDPAEIVKKFEDGKQVD